MKLIWQGGEREGEAKTQPIIFLILFLTNVDKYFYKNSSLSKTSA
jgi:hypothetical protein